jgi:hypothetical protein
MHRSRNAMWALAGLILVAPALRGQERIVSPTFLAPTLAAGADSARAQSVAPSRARQEEPDRTARIGRIVTFTLVGGLVGGALWYVTAKPEFGCTTTTCGEYRERRMLQGALVGGAIGGTIGAIVVLGGGGRPRLVIRPGR